MVVKKDQFIIFGQVDHRFLFPLKIENPSQKEHNRILYGGGDPTIMYLLRALKYQLLSSSKMEESMQQYSHKYEVLHSGQKRKNVKKKKNTSQK